jgi:hypothetical protein
LKVENPTKAVFQIVHYSKSNKVQRSLLTEQTPFLKAQLPNSLDLKQKDELEMAACRISLTN